ncbi:hypothetical protein [Cedecea colo]|uniref:hypothetical protein n=1 Tax=Cedecea colo TaxID=2552946 RepID=UPI001F477613|nr:hypothetical protein [Cedecea colo]
MTKATLKKFLCVTVLAVFSPLTQAGAYGGVIQFRGAIVEGGCDISPQGQKVAFSCYKQGKPTTFTVALNQLAGGSIHSNSLMQTDIQYLDQQRRLAIVNVTWQ